MCVTYTYFPSVSMIFLLCCVTVLMAQYVCFSIVLCNCYDGAVCFVFLLCCVTVLMVQCVLFFYSVV